MAESRPSSPEAGGWGPVGVRSDNGTYDFELRVPGGGKPDATCPAGAHVDD